MASSVAKTAAPVGCLQPFSHSAAAGRPRHSRLPSLATCAAHGRQTGRPSLGRASAAPSSPLLTEERKQQMSEQHAQRQQRLEQQWERQQQALPAGPGAAAAGDGTLPGGSAAADDNSSSNGSTTLQPPDPSLLLPKLALLGAAALWGSYSPSVRLLYESAHPPDAVVVMAARGLLQGATLLGLTLALQARSPQQQQQQEQQQQHHKQQQHADSSSGGGCGSSGSSSSLLQQFLRVESPPLWMAALELGFYNYAATGLQTFGLQLIGATRASFLIQATLMLTPLLSLVAGFRPARQVWAACALALAGTMLITADEAGGAAGGAGGMASAGLQLSGDAALLTAALFYSLGFVRLALYARSLPALRVAAGKSVVLGGLAVGALLLAAGNAVAQGQEVSSLWGGYDDPTAWAALLWAGLGPGALASYLHVKGQQHVAPADAQILFSTKPLMAAALAWVLLGDEQLGPLTWVGGSALVAAGLVASTAPPQQQQQLAAAEKQR